MPRAALPRMCHPKCNSRPCLCIQASRGFRQYFGLIMSLVTIFAIGACYEGIAEPEDQDVDGPEMSLQHQRYFEHATAIAQKYTSKHTVDFVCALLAQCFYLLATCQTDRCWTTLGLAVRIAQSIGLHVEDERCPDLGRSLAAPREQRRRVWYSIFILDRLVAMQLGRPPAICDGNFNVRLPSRQSDTDLVDVTSQGDSHGQYWAGDYFIAMIAFSEIIGKVFNNLYGPRKSDDAASTLSTIDRLNPELLQWRSNLPRNLRFDLSHTFEKSTVYKRQVCDPFLNPAVEDYQVTPSTAEHACHEVLQFTSADPSTFPGPQQDTGVMSNFFRVLPNRG